MAGTGRQDELGDGAAAGGGCRGRRGTDDEPPGPDDEPPVRISRRDCATTAQKSLPFQNLVRPTMFHRPPSCWRSSAVVLAELGRRRAGPPRRVPVGGDVEHARQTAARRHHQPETDELVRLRRVQARRPRAAAAAAVGRHGGRREWELVGGGSASVGGVSGRGASSGVREADGRWGRCFKGRRRWMGGAVR